MNLAAGVVALAWPGPTALVLVLIVGTWVVIAGFVEIGAAFAAGEPTGTRALFILGGLVSIAFGVVLYARPGVGAITLALLFGLYNLVYGAGRSCRASSCAGPARPSAPPSRQGKRRRPDPMARPSQADGNSDARPGRPGGHHSSSRPPREVVPVSRDRRGIQREIGLDDYSIMTDN